MNMFLSGLAVLWLALVSSGDEPVTRAWYGELDAGARIFRFRVESPDNASQDSTGTTASLISLDEGGHKFALEEFRSDEQSMSFKLPLTQAEFDGLWADDRSLCNGTWKQRGTESSLLFRPCEPGYVPRAEVWSGIINAGIQKLELRFRIDQDAAGADRVLFDSVTQRVGGFKAVREVAGEQWTIRIDSIRGEFSGTISADRSEIRGTWKQGLVPLELVLTQSSENPSPPLPPRRPQLPTPPYPYATQDVAFRNEADGVTLAGTLCIPSPTDGDERKPVAAVILISGSGPQDRDETLMGHRPFLVIADYLARHGIASLRYDDRGVGQSSGDFAAADSQAFARDVQAAFRYLQTDDRIDPHRIGLIGHSEGGLIAPLVAVDQPDVAFLVLLAGTGVNGREILLSQGRLALIAEGVTDQTQLDKQTRQSTALVDIALSAAADVSTESLLPELLTRLKDDLPDGAADDPAVRESLKGTLDTFRSPWFRFFLKHEPAPVLERVHCPVLALNGEKDVQVDPKLNLPHIQAALKKAGQAASEVRELAGLNHLFQNCRTGGLSEYESIEETIAPVVLETLVEWIHAASAIRNPQVN